MFTTYFYKFLQNFSAGYRLKLSVLFFMAIIAGILEFLGIALIFPLILLILKPENIMQIPFLAKYGDTLTGKNAVLFITIGIICAFVIKNIFMILNTRYQTSILKTWLCDLNLVFFKKYLFSSYQSKLNLESKYSIFQVWQISGIVFGNFISRVLNLSSSVFILAIIFAFLVWKFNFWAILTSIFFIVSGLFQNKFFKTKGREITRKIINLMDVTNQSIISAIRNIKDIKIFGREIYFYKAYEKYLKEKARLETDFDFYAAIPQNIVELCIIAAVIIMSYGVVATSDGNSDTIIASFGMLAAAVFRMAPLVNKIQMHMNFINANKPAVQEFFDAYEQYCKMGGVSEITDELQPFKRELVIKNLTFGYGERNVIENLNVSIQKGEFVGIIGPSGVGKTTFMDLLMGLLAADNGDILIDNDKLAGKTMQKWINVIGYVPQEVTTLPVSIAKNIAFGIDDKDIDYDMIYEAAHKAQLDDYLKGLKDGINTKLNDLQSLSQGQKQRIGIARALYKNPEILFLDEITSALDVETENKITECLNSLKGEKTIIAIAHRLSTLKKCDRILYFKSKDCILSGTFDSLSKSDPDFEQLIRLSAVNNLIH